MHRDIFNWIATNFARCHWLQYHRGVFQLDRDIFQLDRDRWLEFRHKRPTILVQAKYLPWRRAPLQWRHTGPDGVSNHQPHHCLLNRLFRRRSRKTSMLRVTGLCAENSPVTGEFSVQMASGAQNVSIWWRHHARGVVSRIYLYPHVTSLRTHSPDGLFCGDTLFIVND